MKIFTHPELNSSQRTDNTSMSDTALVGEDDCLCLPHGPQVPTISVAD